MLSKLTFYVAQFSLSLLATLNLNAFIWAIIQALEATNLAYLVTHIAFAIYALASAIWLLSIVFHNHH